MRISLSLFEIVGEVTVWVVEKSVLQRTYIIAGIYSLVDFHVFVAVVVPFEKADNLITIPAAVFYIFSQKMIFSVYPVCSMFGFVVLTQGRFNLPA